jgi:hypothetical protein
VLKLFNPKIALLTEIVAGGLLHIASFLSTFYFLLKHNLSEMESPVPQFPLVVRLQDCKY